MKRAFKLYPLFLLCFGSASCCSLFFENRDRGRDNIDWEEECIKIGISVGGAVTNQRQSTEYGGNELDGTLHSLKSTAVIGQHLNAESTQQQLAGESGESLLGYSAGVYSAIPLAPKIGLVGALMVTAKGS